MLKTSFLAISATALMLTLNSCGGSTTETTASGPDASGLDVEKHYTSTADFVDCDLSSYGYPVVMKAPKGAKVLKDTVSHRLSVYGGKYFKCTVSPNDSSFESPAAFFTLRKINFADKEMAPNFSKYLIQQPLALLVENKGEGISNGFDVVLPSKKEVVFYILTEGMAFDINPDGNSDFTPADVKTMFEAAKMARLK